jgi:hypothetical protein
MNTSILTALLLSSLFVPTWHGNYSQAQREAANQKKPLVVVFGSGSNSWSKIIRDKAPTEEVSKLLLKDYVCVYVDTDMPDGQRLAKSFELTGKVGLVISDRALSTQAFWHQGDMTHDHALHYLQKYARPDIVVQGTETTTMSRVSYYPSQAPNFQTRSISSASC